MARVSAGFGGPDGHRSLALLGPTVRVQIGFDPAYVRGGRPNLSDALHAALVDTGATYSCVDSELADGLGLPIVNQRQIAGVQGVSTADVYLLQIHVPDLPGTMYGEFSGVHLSDGGIPHRALLGRDFLQNFEMIYDGRTGRVTISNGE